MSRASEWRAKRKSGNVDTKAQYKGTDTIQSITAPKDSGTSRANAWRVAKGLVTSSKPVTSPEVQSIAEKIVKQEQAKPKKQSFWSTFTDEIRKSPAGAALGFVKTAVNATIVEPAKTLAEFERGILEESRKKKTDKTKVTVGGFAKEIPGATKEVVRGLADWVWAGTAGTLMRGVEDVTRKVTKDKGPSMVKSPFGGGSEVAQDAFQRRRAEGMTTSEALGAASSDLAMNVGMILGTIDQVKAIPNTFRNATVFRSEKGVTIRVKDIEGQLQGKNMSPAKQRAILEIQSDPKYIKASEAVKRAALEQGIDVRTAERTSFAERLGINPDNLGVTLKVGKKPAFGQKPTMGQFDQLQTMKEMPTELMDTSPKGLMTKAQKVDEPMPAEPITSTPTQLKQQAKELGSELRNAEKQQVTAELELQKAKSGIEPIPPEKTTSISVEVKLKPGDYLTDSAGKPWRVTEDVAHSNAFRIVDEVTGVERVKNLESMVEDGFRKVQEGVQPKRIAVDEAKIAELQAKVDAINATRADAQKQLISTKEALKPPAEPKPLPPLEYKEGKPISMKPGQVGKPIAAKYNRETGVVTTNHQFIANEFPGWLKRHPNTKLTTEELFTKFIQEHELAHRNNPRGENESELGYERRMNIIANKSMRRQGVYQLPKAKTQPGTTPVEARPAGKYATPVDTGKTTFTEMVNGKRREVQMTTAEAEKVKALMDQRDAEIVDMGRSKAEELSPSEALRIVRKQESVPDERSQIIKERIERRKAEALDRSAKEESRKAYEQATPTERTKVINETPESNPMQKKVVMASVKRTNRFSEWMRNANRIYNEIFYPKRNLTPKTQAIVKAHDTRIKLAEIKALRAAEHFSDIPGKIGDWVTREYESGRATKWTEKIKKVYADAREIAQATLGKAFGEFENYAGRLEYYDKPGAVIEAISKKLQVEKGMSKADADAWAKGELVLNNEEAIRLKVNPSFTKNRFFESVADAEKYGLHPKNLHPAQRYANYIREYETALANKELYDALLKNRDIVPSGSAPAGFKEVNQNFMPNMKARPEVADFINGQYEMTGRPLAERFLRAIPAAGHELSKFMTNLVLSAGFPLTPVNFLASSYLLLRAGYGGDYASIGAYMRSFSNAKSLGKIKTGEYIRAMWDMAQENHAIGQTLASPNMLYENIGKIWRGKGKTAAASAVWERMWSKRTFNSLLPQMQIEHYLGVKRALIKKGYSELDARAIATRSMALSYGTIDTTQRSKLTDDLLASVFFAPKFRESMVNIAWNMVKSIAQPSAWKDPAYQAPRKTAAVMMTTYALANVANHKLNGHYMWNNPPGKELALQIPLPDGKRNIYLPLFPSVLGLQKSILMGTYELAKGNPGKAARQFGQVQSIPLRLAEQLATNKNAFGKPIWFNAENAYLSPNKQADSPQTIVWNIMSYIASQSSHPWINEPWQVLTKEKPVDEALAKMFEFLPSFGNKEKEQLASAIDSGQELAKYIAQFVPEHRPEVIKAELIKWPEPMRLEILQELKKADPTLEESKYKLSDDELKAWKEGSHPVKLMKGLDSVNFDVSKDRIIIVGAKDFFLTWGEAFKRDPVGALRGALKRDLIRKFRGPSNTNGIVVWERRSKLPISTKSGYERDHIQPKAFGGQDQYSNLQYLTIKENRDKTSVQNKLMDDYENGRITEREAIDILTNRNHKLPGDNNAQWRALFAKMTPEEAKQWYEKNIPK